MASTERIHGLLERFVDLSSSPTQSEQERAYKSTHVLIAGVTAPVVLLWSVVYGVLGLGVAAAIPLIYASLTAPG